MDPSAFDGGSMTIEVGAFGGEILLCLDGLDGGGIGGSCSKGTACFISFGDVESTTSADTCAAVLSAAVRVVGGSSAVGASNVCIDD